MYKRQGQLGSKNTTSIWHIDPLLRVADLYLMYAEAVNEAYGPSGTAENYPLTAREAFDIVRKRIGMPRVKSTVGQEEFRLRIQNERCVELAYDCLLYTSVRTRYAIISGSDMFTTAQF